MARMRMSADAYIYRLMVNTNKRAKCHRGRALEAQTRRRRCLVCNEPMPLDYADSICEACRDRGYRIAGGVA